MLYDLERSKILFEYVYVYFLTVQHTFQLKILLRAQVIADYKMEKPRLYAYERVRVKWMDGILSCDWNWKLQQQQRRRQQYTNIEKHKKFDLQFYAIYKIKVNHIKWTMYVYYVMTWKLCRWTLNDGVIVGNCIYKYRKSTGWMELTLQCCNT